MRNGNLYKTINLISSFFFLFGLFRFLKNNKKQKCRQLKNIIFLSLLTVHILL